MSYFVLSHQLARKRAAQAVAEAPEGHIVTIREPRKSRDQEEKYHAQIGEGNLIELVERAASLIGEIQVADVPGRCEPGTGEINYPAIARALHRIAYTGVVGLVGWARDSSEDALGAFRAAFAEAVEA